MYSRTSELIYSIFISATTHLVDYVKELEEDGRKASVSTVLSERAAVSKFVAKSQPLLFDEHPEPFQGSVKGIQADLSHRRNLSYRNQFRKLQLEIIREFV